MYRIVIFSSALVFSMNTFAQNVQQENGVLVNLTVTNLGHFDPTNDQNPPMKSPVQPPYVTLDDHTLYIWSQHTGYTLTLLDDNDTVVYQTYVAAGVQFADLPSTLSGSFTLILSDDTYMYIGSIGLE